LSLGWGCGKEGRERGTEEEEEGPGRAAASASARTKAKSVRRYILCVSGMRVRCDLGLQ
jgi:hypothetical protein